MKIFIQSGWIIVFACFSGFVLATEQEVSSVPESQVELPVQVPAKVDRVYVEPTFVVSGFQIEGPALIDRERILSLLVGFVDRPITFSELRQATEAVERLHGLAGFEVVRVLIPEQELAPNSKLTLQILDARLDLITVKNNQFFSSEQMTREVHVLRQGVLLNTHDMDKNLRLVNQNPARTVQVALEPGDEPGLVNATINVQDSEPLVGFVTLDNTGTNATGDFRLGAVVQHNNLFTRGHSGSFQVVTSPGHWSDVKVYGLTYQMPLYALDSLLEYAINDSSVNAGALAVGGTNLMINGAGTSQTLRLTRVMNRIQGFDPRLSLSFEHKKFVSQVQVNGTGPSLVPNTASFPVGLTLLLKSEQPNVQQAFSVGYFRNAFQSGENSTAQYQLSNAAADANFDLIKLNASWSGPVFSTWRYSVKLDAQFSDFSLISGEQFGSGGVYSVRGFEERVLSGDSGFRQSFEMLGPNWSKKIHSSLDRFRMVLFAEAAQVRLNSAVNVASEPHIASFGAGFRFAFTPNQQINLDLARVVSGVESQPHGDVMLHFSFATAL